MLIYIVGVLYIVFVLKEVKVAPSSNDNAVAVDNPAFVNDNEGDKKFTTSQITLNADLATSEITKKGFLREFFDPTLAIEIFQVVFKKREGNLREFILIVLLCNIFFLASLGEIDLTYLYTRLKINWSGVEFTLHLTYGTIVALVGTLLMVGVFSKYLGISDPMIGIISSICSLIARPIYVRMKIILRLFINLYIFKGICYKHIDVLYWNFS